MTSEPAAALSLGSAECGLNVFLTFVVRAVEPDSRLPIRVLIVLLDVARQGLDVVVNERMTQFASRSFNYHVLVHFHVGHAGILILQAAFETAQAFAE